MATTNAMVSSRVLLLLLTAILAVVASVCQATVSALSPSADGQCTPDYISELGNCVDYRLGRAERRGLPPLYKRERCCQNVSGKPNAARCLCAAFRRDPEVPDRADFSGFVNDVLFACDGPEVSDITCPASTSI